MKFDTKCITCGSSKDLNTVLTVTIDDVKYPVKICDEHADDITPKQVKKLVQGKLDEYNELVEKMKEFGLDITENTNIAVAKRATPADTEPENTEIPNQTTEPRKIVLANSKGEIVAEKAFGKELRIKKSKGLPTVRSVSGVAQGQVATQNIESHRSIDISEQTQSAITAAKGKGIIGKDQEIAMPVTEEIEYQVVAGRGGKPMRIPKHIKHNVGSTLVAVIDTGGDRTIQTRFKEMAAMSKVEGVNTHIYGRDGYDTEPCVLCEGSGINKVNKGECPKCKGVGFLNRGWVKG